MCAWLDLESIVRERHEGTARSLKNQLPHAHAMTPRIKAGLCTHSAGPVLAQAGEYNFERIPESKSARVGAMHQATSKRGSKALAHVAKVSDYILKTAFFTFAYASSVVTCVSRVAQTRTHR